jgi:hypothetical protein
MAFKYPIPYMCSCPSGYFGSHCEIEVAKAVSSTQSYSNSEENIYSEYDDSLYSTTTTGPNYPYQDIYGYMQQEQRSMRLIVANETNSTTTASSTTVSTTTITIMETTQPSTTTSFFSNTPSQTTITSTITTKIPTTIRTKNSTFTTRLNSFYLNDFKVVATQKKKFSIQPSLNQFLQCPSNCNFYLRRGFCKYSSKLKRAYCSCNMGWSGVDCSTRDYCSNNLCENNSTCVNRPELKGYVCQCSAGFKGSKCEIKMLNLKKSEQKINQVQILSSIINNHSTTQAPTSLIDTDARLIMKGFKFAKTSQYEEGNPCQNDPDICRKFPIGNSSYICVKSFLSQDYTLCMPTRTMNCKNSPCLNNGVCIENDSGSIAKSSWKCICSPEFTGRLCETEVCSNSFKFLSNHTMCQPDSKKFSSGEVGSNDIELIVDFHNAIRKQVAPIASNMQKVNQMSHV